MTADEADRVASRWIGFAVAASHDVAIPPNYSREDWRAEALYGLAYALRRWRPRFGYLSGAGAPARYLRRGIVKHLLNCRTTALRMGRPKLNAALHLDGPDVIASATTGEPLTMFDTTPNPNSPDPLDVVIEREMIDTLRAASETLTPPERVSLGFLLRGLSPSEVAPILGITRQAAGERERRVRAKLRPVFGLAA